jgi:hypothetical protein
MVCFAFVVMPDASFSRYLPAEARRYFPDWMWRNGEVIEFARSASSLEFTRNGGVGSPILFWFSGPRI